MNEPKTKALEDDEALQAAVIRHLIDVHPGTLSRADLMREFGHPKFETLEDEIERAVRDLARLGLLDEAGERVCPSRAAVRYHELANYMGGP